MLFDIFIAIGDRRIGKFEDPVRRERRAFGHEFDKITEKWRSVRLWADILQKTLILAFLFWVRRTI